MLAKRKPCPLSTARSHADNTHGCTPCTAAQRTDAAGHFEARGAAHCHTQVLHLQPVDALRQDNAGLHGVCGADCSLPAMPASQNWSLDHLRLRGGDFAPTLASLSRGVAFSRRSSLG